MHMHVLSGLCGPRIESTQSSFQSPVSDTKTIAATIFNRPLALNSRYESVSSPEVPIKSVESLFIGIPASLVGDPGGTMDSLYVMSTCQAYSPD